MSRAERMKLSNWGVVVEGVGLITAHSLHTKTVGFSRRCSAAVGGSGGSMRGPRVEVGVVKCG